ncbi:MAG: coproporphyrinogen III oxidase, partial [Gammaproteobacteria bacterium]
LVKWRYNWQPEPGTAEAKLYDVFLKPQDWAAATVAETQGQARQS